MEIPANAEVYCADGVCGRSTFIILNPTNDEVTHFVVQESDILAKDRLVPVDLIAESSAQKIQLRCTKAELGKLEVFTKTQFLDPGRPILFEASALFWPYAVPQELLMTEVTEHVPPGELAVRRGARVDATDGHVGQVDEFLIDPTNGHITHLILREGHLWGQKDVTIPVSQIDHFEEDVVFLKLNKHSIEALPSIPIKR